MSQKTLHCVKCTLHDTLYRIQKPSHDKVETHHLKPMAREVREKINYSQPIRQSNYANERMRSHNRGARLCGVESTRSISTYRARIYMHACAYGPGLHSHYPWNSLRPQSTWPNAHRGHGGDIMRTRASLEVMRIARAKDSPEARFRSLNLWRDNAWLPYQRNVIRMNNDRVLGLGIRSWLYCDFCSK